MLRQVLLVRLPHRSRATGGADSGPGHVTRFSPISSNGIRSACSLSPMDLIGSWTDGTGRRARIFATSRRCGATLKNE